MAWQARLSQAIVPNGKAVTATFEFYDDVTPLVILWVEVFSFSPAYTNAQMQQAVQTRGAELRTAKQRADTLAVAFPVGTTIAIP